MKYEMLPRETIDRVWDAYSRHSACINKKYESFRGKDTYWSSDRERFIGRLYRKLAGKYIVLADREVRGYQSGNYFSLRERTSIFSSDYVHGESYHHGDAIMCTSRKYLCINGIGVTNTMYGDGYITVSCTDVFANRVTLYLCPWNLGDLQYRESSADEFNSVAALFNDDRDEIPFEVRRMLTMEEMEERRIKAKRKRIKVESVWETVMARDSSEAMKKVENAIEVRPVSK